VEGRLLRVERHLVPPVSTVLALKLERVEIAGSMVRVTAVRDWSRELSRSRKRRQAGFGAGFSHDVEDPRLETNKTA
jgi:hypothetical protein